MSKNDVPIWEKITLSVEETAALFRIGENKLRKIATEQHTAEFLLWNGSRPQFIRKKFEAYIEKIGTI